MRDTTRKNVILGAIVLLVVIALWAFGLLRFDSTVAY
jgi:hypothetical protein